MGDRLGDQRLAGSGGTEQQDSPGRGDAEVLEQLRLGQGPLDALLEPRLDLFEAANVLPSLLGHLDVDLAQRGGLYLAHGHPEVVHGDLHLLQHFRRDLFSLEVDLRQVAPERLHGTLSHQRADVGADEPVTVLERPIHVEVVGDRHAARVDADDLPSTLLVRDADLDLPVEASRSAQRLVDGVSPVGGSDDDDVVASLHAVHQREQLGDDSALDLARDFLPLGSDAVEFIDEDDRRRMLGRLIEDIA